MNYKKRSINSFIHSVCEERYADAFNALETVVNESLQKKIHNAYKLFSEKTVFYVSSDNGEQPEPVGEVSDKGEVARLKDIIKGASFRQHTAQLLKLSNVTETNKLLKRPDLQLMFHMLGFTTDDINELVENKSKLTDFLDAVKEQSTNGFNLYNVVVENILKYTKDATHEQVEKLARELTEISGKEHPATIGPSELMLSIITSGTRPKTNKGDVAYGDKIVEVKSALHKSQAALSRAEYAKRNLSNAVAKIEQKIKTNNNDDIVHADMFKLKKQYENVIDGFVNELEGINKLTHDSASFEVNDTTIKQLKDLAKEFTKKQNKKTAPVDKMFADIIGIDLNIINGNVSTRPFKNAAAESIKTKIVNVTNENAFSSILPNVLIAFTKFIRAVRNKPSKAGEPTSVFRTFYSTTFTDKISSASLDKLKNRLFAVCVSDSTSAEDVAALLYEGRIEEQSSANLYNDILNALKADNNSRLKQLKEEKNFNTLKNLVFAVHLVEYARVDEFGYFVVNNYTTGASFSIPVDNFSAALNFIETVGSKIKFDIDYHGKFGSHSVSVKQ